MEFPVTYQIHDLPVTSFTLQNLYDAMMDNITGYIEETVMPSRVAIDLTGASFAPWMNGSTWNVWNEDTKAYRPNKVVVGSVSLWATPTANRMQSLQEKDGTVALLDDVYGIRNTVILPDGAVGVDWDTGTTFKCIVKRKTYFHMQHSRQGMEIRLLVVNNGTDNTLLWDDTILWPFGTPPVMPSSSAGASVSMLVTLRNIGGTIYGESMTQPSSVL